jgi:hypothetical protein
VHLTDFHQDPLALPDPTQRNPSQRKPAQTTMEAKELRRKCSPAGRAGTRLLLILSRPCHRSFFLPSRHPVVHQLRPQPTAPALFSMYDHTIYSISEAGIPICCINSSLHPMQQNEKILVYYEWNRAHDICFSCFVSTMHQNTHERLNETKGEQSRVFGTSVM